MISCPVVKMAIFAPSDSSRATAGSASGRQRSPQIQLYSAFLECQAGNKERERRHLASGVVEIGVDVLWELSYLGHVRPAGGPPDLRFLLPAVTARIVNRERQISRGIAPYLEEPTLTLLKKVINIYMCAVLWRRGGQIGRPIGP